MNNRSGRPWKVVSQLILITGMLWLAACGSRARVGELQNESQTVELGESENIRLEVFFGAGDLQVSGGAADLLEADFTYNVAELKPEVEYEGDRLTVTQPDSEGFPVLRDIAGFRNEWDLHLNDSVPMDMKVTIGAGTADLQLASLTLRGLEVSLGAGESTVDLSGDWANDLDVNIDAGAGNLTVRLPSQVGVRVQVEAGIGSIEAPGLTKDGDVYTNAVYGDADVTLRVDIEAGIGQIRLEVADSAAVMPASMLAGWFSLPLAAN